MPENRNWRDRGDWGSSNGGHSSRRANGPGRNGDSDSGCGLLVIGAVALVGAWVGGLWWTIAEIVERVTG